jgi:hypothetical protein
MFENISWNGSQYALISGTLRSLSHIQVLDVLKPECKKIADRILSQFPRADVPSFPEHLPRSFFRYLVSKSTGDGTPA